MTPNLFIVGAAKCGTTTLHEYLNFHKDIFMSNPKEPHFMLRKYFNERKLVGPGDERIISNYILNFDDYISLFSKNNKIRGESSPGYFSLPEYSIPAIKELNSDPFIIICLRNPVERVFSAYLHKKKRGYESTDFRNIVFKRNEIEKLRVNWSFGWNYFEDSFYFNRIKLFKDNFEKVKILYFEKFITNHEQALAETTKFLSINGHFSIDQLPRSNPSLFTKNKTLYSMLASTYRPIKDVIPSSIKDKAQSLLTFKPKLGIAERRELQNIFFEDVQNLSELVGKDLISFWGFDK